MPNPSPGPEALHDIWQVLNALDGAVAAHRDALVRIAPALPEPEQQTLADTAEGLMEAIGSVIGLLALHAGLDLDAVLKALKKTRKPGD